MPFREHDAAIFHLIGGVIDVFIRHTGGEVGDDTDFITSLGSVHRGCSDTVVRGNADYRDSLDVVLSEPLVHGDGTGIGGSSCGSGGAVWAGHAVLVANKIWLAQHPVEDRKSTRLNSSHVSISYA